MLERDARGVATGRLWRGDAWLRTRTSAEPPPLAPVGRRLAAFGVTALTDASVTTDSAAAESLAEAVRRGDLPQRLTLMSGGPLQAPADHAIRVGPVKLLLDDHDLPSLEAVAETIARARGWGRAVAVHCVTAAELALALAGFHQVGARPGDRIEHGGMIPETAIGELQALGLTVVTQPGFVHDRGDRYAAEVEPDEQVDLYRCASLLAAGVPVAGSSDAPYASADPWMAMATATRRRTAGGRLLGRDERIGPRAALGLYLGPPDAPGGPPREVAAGARADLCLLRVPLREALAAPSAELVRATLLAGRLTFEPD
jgi:predicted amidohydrolase YtcJ